MNKIKKVFCFLAGMSTGLIIGVILTKLESFFNLKSLINFKETVHIVHNRYYESEVDSMLTYLGWWNIILIYIGGRLSYCILYFKRLKNIVSDREAGAIKYTFISSTLILIPAYFFELLNNNLFAPRLLKWFFSILIFAFVVCSFGLTRKLYLKKYPFKR